MPNERRTDSATIEVAVKPEVAYAAFADASALMAWLPPGDMAGSVHEYDFREGGRYRIALTYGASRGDAIGKTSDRTDVTSGRFVSLQLPERIVQSVEFESDDPAFAGEMLMTWSFAPSPSGTTITIVASNVPPGISQADHDAGLRSSLQNLARYLGTP
jgi:uncharacterized protein YndB with AHSA1/START domain